MALNLNPNLHLNLHLNLHPHLNLGLTCNLNLNLILHAWAGWHCPRHSLAGGWRAGRWIDLGYSGEMMKVVYYRM